MDSSAAARRLASAATSAGAESGKLAADGPGISGPSWAGLGVADKAAGLGGMTVAGRAVRGVSVAGASGVAGWPGEAGTQFGLMDAPLERVASAAPRVAAAAAAADSAAGAGSTQTVPRPWACNATGDSPRPRSPARPGHRAPSQACSASTSATQAHNDRSNWRWRYAGSGMARCCHASAAAQRRYPVRRHQVRRRRRNDSSPRPAASGQRPASPRSAARARPPWWPPPCRHRTTSRRRRAQSMRCWPPSALPASTRAARTHHRTPRHPAAAPMSRCRRWWPRSSSCWHPGCPGRPRGLPTRQ